MKRNSVSRFIPTFVPTSEPGKYIDITQLTDSIMRNTLTRDLILWAGFGYLTFTLAKTVDNLTNRINMLEENTTGKESDDKEA